MATPSVKYRFDMAPFIRSETHHWEPVGGKMHSSIQAAHAKKLDYLFVLYEFTFNERSHFHQGWAKDLPKDFATQGQLLLTATLSETKVLCKKVHFFVIPCMEDIGRYYATQVVGEPPEAMKFFDLFQEVNSLVPSRIDIPEYDLAQLFMEMGKPAEYLRYLKKGASQGHLTALAELIKGYEKGLIKDGRTNIPCDPKQAFAWAKYGAEDPVVSDPEFQLTLATYFRKGIGTERDLEASFYWVHRAANTDISKPWGNICLDVAKAKYRLGLYFEQGIGTSKDRSLAFQWYKRSAIDHLYPLAQCRVGVCYMKGRGTPSDYCEAKRWFETCLDIGEANFELGHLYYNGWGGTTRSRKTAIKHFTRAKELGYRLPFIYDKLCTPPKK